MADELVLPPETITALRARHVAFLAERLTDERAHGDFVRSFEAGYDHVLAQPLGTLVRPRELVDAVAAALGDSTVRGVLSPIARELHRRVVLALREDQRTLGDFVPETSRAAIDALLARPDLVPEALVRRVIEEDAVDEIMRDLMYDGLVEFNDAVNPFFADWGLPALIKRFMPIGSGAVLKSMQAVRGEFDKRLEPEIRKFLLGFSRKSKTKLADFLVAQGGDPKLVKLRQSVARFFYGETLAAALKNVDDDARMELDEAVEGIVREVLAAPREPLVRELEKLVAENGTVGEWLARIGVTTRPDLEKLAELLWPFVKLALESPPARAFWERVTWDFYATL